MDRTKMTDMAAWLRQRAKQLNDAADILDHETKFLPTKGIVVEATGTASGGATVEAISGVIENKRGAGRAKEIAKRLGTTREQVLKILKRNPRVFQVAKYGWIKMQPTNGA
jgi:hypothetical protein